MAIIVKLDDLLHDRLHLVSELQRTIGESPQVNGSLSAATFARTTFSSRWKPLKMG